MAAALLRLRLAQLGLDSYQQASALAPQLSAAAYLPPAYAAAAPTYNPYSSQLAYAPAYAPPYAAYQPAAYAPAYAQQTAYAQPQFQAAYAAPAYAAPLYAPAYAEPTYAAYQPAYAPAYAAPTQDDIDPALLGGTLLDRRTLASLSPNAFSKCD